MRRSSFAALAVLLAVGIATTPAVVAGQSLWEHPGDRNTAGVEWMRPDMKIDDMGGASSAVFLFGRFSISPLLTVLAALPVAYGSMDSQAFEVSASALAIGNPLIGARIRPPLMPFSFDVSLRLPLASIGDDDDKALAYLTGMAADLHRMEAFMPDLIPVYVRANYGMRVPMGPDFRVHAGPVLWINRDDEPDLENTWWFFNYGAEAGYQVAQVRLAGALTGRYDVSAEDLDFGERTSHQLGLAASFKTANMRPGLFARIPLDEDTRDLVGWVVGLGFSITRP
jgi:hypothetical protein